MANFFEIMRERIATASTDVDRAYFQAEYGCYLARMGLLDEARAIAGHIRAAVGIERNPRLASWTLLLEGLILYFSGSGVSSVDKFSRALALSLAARDLSMVSRVASWNALMEFLGGDFDKMAQSIATAKANSERPDSEPMGRCYMTIACGYALIGEEALANHYFSKSRQIAIAVGDQASISAVIFNRISHKISRLRYNARRHLGQVISDALVEMELSSSENYDQAARIGALAEMSLFWRARFSMLEGRPSAAMELLADARNKSNPGVRELRGIELDLGWCHFLMGDYSATHTILSRALDNAHYLSLDADDRAIFFALCIELSRNHGYDLESMPILERGLKDAEEEHTDLLQRLVGQLNIIRITVAI